MPLFVGKDISQVRGPQEADLSLAFGVFIKGALGINSYGSEGKEARMSRGRS